MEIATFVVMFLAGFALAGLAIELLHLLWLLLGNMHWSDVQEQWFRFRFWLMVRNRQ